MMKTPLITIVVPVYKVPEHMLRRCLDSIASQTCNEYEVIVVDDGSPDDCGKICEEYANLHKNFHVIHQANAGLAVVRNVGINSAEGKWICFVDGDDWIEPETVFFAKNYIDKYADADVLIWDEFCYTRTEKKENFFLDKNIHGTVVFQGEEILSLFDAMLPEKYKKGNSLVYADIGNCHARIYRIDFLKENKIYNQPELRRMQDNVFTLWVFSKAKKICYTCKRLYHYSFNEDAATKKYNQNICENLEMVYKYMIEFADMSYPGEEFRQRIYTRFARLFLKIVEQKHANPNNPLPFREKLGQMRKDFLNPNYQEIIQGINLKGQSGRVIAPIIMLRMKAYFLMYVLVKAVVFTREYRMKRR